MLFCRRREQFDWLFIFFSRQISGDEDVYQLNSRSHYVNSEKALGLLLHG